MHPVLKPGVRVLRTPHTLTLTLGERVMHRSSPSAAALGLLRGLDGSRDTDTLIRTVANDAEVPPAIVNAALTRWINEGCIEDLDARSRAFRRLTQEQRERLSQDADAWSHAHSSPTTAHARLTLRLGRWVDVRGSGRLAVGVAHLLTASAVGHVSLRDWEGTTTSTLTPRDVGPLGPRRLDVGTSPLEALRALLAPSSTATGSRERRAPDPTFGADLTVIIGPPTTPLADELLRRENPHLFVHADVGAGIVGPFVIPGRTACARCSHRSSSRAPHARAPREPDDPTWRDLDSVTATATAALATAQILVALEGRERPATADHILRLDPTQGMVRAQRHAPHPDCGCTWPRAERPAGHTMAG